MELAHARLTRVHYALPSDCSYPVPAVRIERDDWQHLSDSKALPASPIWRSSRRSSKSIDEPEEPDARIVGVHHGVVHADLL